MNVWEILLSAFLAFVLATALGALDKLGAFRRRRLKEPPLDKGFIPWLGHALQFKKDAVAFLDRMKKKHGDIFTVLLGGNYIHFVLDPHTYGTIIKESKEKLDFDAFGSMVVYNAFGFQSTEFQHKTAQTMSKKNLRGKGLTTLNQVMMEKLQAVMLPSQDSSKKERPWQQNGILEFSYKSIFRAAVISLFGTEQGQDVETKENAMERKTTPLEVLYENFLKFDHLFPALVMDLLDPVSKKEAESLKMFFWDVLSIEKMYHKDNISSWVTELDQSMAEIGMTEKMRTQMQLLLLWASQANTGPATFWTLLHLLKHPEAMKAVKEEVDREIKEAGQEVTSDNYFIQVSLDTMKTPLLDSSVEETLRLRAAPFVFRGVVQDMDLKTGSGREYMLRKGDHLILVPFVGLHLNPEIYPDPHTFKYDRFANPDGSKKEFYKDGKKLKYPTMPFGGGPSMCPGRFFAVSEIKLFIIMMLTYFEMELVNQDDDIPPVVSSRCGIGITHPTHDVQFRYRLKF